MTGAAWKDTQQDQGSKPRLSADLLVGIRMTAVGIKPGHPSPIPVLSSAQKQALSEASHAGYHVGLPLAFTAIVYVESSGCKNVHGDNGLAFGCSQVHEAAAYAATGVHIPPWILSDPDLRALNMAVGAKYLQLCIDRFGWPAGAACYNQGLYTRLSHHALIHLRYTRRVLAAMAWLRQLPMSKE